MTKAIFMDTGGGDIYAAETKEQILRAMRADMGNEFEPDEVFEVDGETMMQHEERGQITLQDNFDECLRKAPKWRGLGFCIASDNG